MTETVVIELAGEVVAKGRPKFAMRGKGQRPIAYTPGKTRQYEDQLRLAAHNAMAGRPLLLGPLLMRVTASLPVPGSWSEKKRKECLTQAILPTKRPDLDNYIKIALDALNCVVFADDNQIVALTARKEYSAKPGIKIVVGAYPLQVVNSKRVM